MVDNELFRNGSGYADLVAYEAMKKYERDVEKMELYGGDIFKGRMASGSEKYFVVLSVHDRYSTVLMIGDNKNLPFAIKCEGMKYTDPGQIQYVFNDQLLDFIRAMTQTEYDDLMKAVIDSLGCKIPVKEVIKEVPVPSSTVATSETNMEELFEAKAEAKIYKDLYESLLKKVMG